MENKTYWILAGIVILILGGMYLQKQIGLFAILPSGQSNSNVDCTFITNIDPGTNGWTVADYAISSTKWIAVDVNGDGTKETFAGYGSVSSSSSNVCDSTNYAGATYLPINALGDFRLKYGKSTNDASNIAPYLMICSGNMLYRYNSNYGSSGNAITTCAGTCTPSWQTGSWSACISGTQTRTVTDANNCGVTTGQPATSQSCTVTCTDASWIPDTSTICSGTSFTQTSNCGNTRSILGTKENAEDCSSPVTRAQLGVIINNWIAGTATRAELGNAITSWVNG